MTLGLDLDALAALERAATPGEWLVALNGSAETCLRFIWRNDYGGNLSPEGRNVGATRVARDFHEKDAALTAALRNAAPQLIAAAREAERLRAALANAERVAQRFSGQACLDRIRVLRADPAFHGGVLDELAALESAASPPAGRRGEG